MSAEKLREAAKVLRERAARAPQPPWVVVEDNHGGYVEPSVEISIWSEMEGRYVTEDVSMVPSGIDYWRSSATYIATMHPGVGLALADWLDASADFHEDKPHGYDCLGCGAESVADAILGGAS